MLDAYCWPQSAAPGERIALHVSTDASSFDVTVARCGATNEIVWRTQGATSGTSAVPDDASASGCGWPPVIEIPVAADWRSGFYAVELTSGGESRDAFFVVRPRADEPASILLVLSTSTWN